jgi:hypothetical protein
MTTPNIGRVALGCLRVHCFCFHCGEDQQIVAEQDSYGVIRIECFRCHHFSATQFAFCVSCGMALPRHDQTCHKSADQSLWGV